MKVDPEGDRAQSGPLIEAERAQRTLQEIRPQRRARYLGAGELQIRPHIRIARREGFGLPIRGDGAPDLTGLEVCVSQIEIERRRNGAGDDQALVTRRRFGKFILRVKSVRRIEGGT